MSSSGPQVPEAESGAAAAASSGRVAAGEDEAVAGVVDVPAEAAVAVAGEGDRVGDRVLAGDALAPASEILAISRTTPEEIAEEGPST